MKKDIRTEIEKITDVISHEALLINWMVKDGFEYYEKKSEEEFKNSLFKHLKTIREHAYILSDILE